MSQACRDLNELLPYVKELAQQLVAKCSQIGVPICITETYRSQERQNELYKQGRTTKGQIVTWTKNSKHITRRAFDFVPLKNGQADWNDLSKFKRVADIGKTLGLTWGGDWSTPDRPHFQYDGAIPEEAKKVEEVKVEQPVQPHYAEPAFDFLNANGVVVHEKNFDAPIKRGDIMILLARMKGYQG